jgi:hypothetical protein
MRAINSLKGFQPITFVRDGILLARKYDLYIADLDCKRRQYIGSVPHTPGVKIASLSRTLERTLRLGIRFGCQVSKNRVLLAERQRFWMLDLNTGAIHLDHMIEQGSRPLMISNIQGMKGFDDGVCYGEYWENKHKEPVNIWLRNDNNIWNVAYTFPNGAIEHIHALVPDKNRGFIWILTGDFDNSPGLWEARDNFSSVVPVLLGRQEFRCCWLAFWGDRIVYATDSPLATNSIRELVAIEQGTTPPLSRTGFRSEHLMEIAGSSIYSCMVQDQLVFSTTVEPGMPSGILIRDLMEYRPGPGIKDNCSYLMSGTPERGFSVIGAWRKDKLPPRLCEFGAIKFPTGVNPGGYLYAYFTGLSGTDGSMSVFDLSR